MICTHKTWSTEPQEEQPQGGDVPHDPQTKVNILTEAEIIINNLWQQSENYYSSTKLTVHILFPMGLGELRFMILSLNISGY